MTKIERLELQVLMLKLIKGSTLTIYDLFKNHPKKFSFEHSYQFYVQRLPLVVIENRPAWERDSLYYKGVLTIAKDSYYFDKAHWSWNPPLATISLTLESVKFFRETKFLPYNKHFHELNQACEKVQK